MLYIPADTDGDLSEAISIYGNITFSGTGTYVISNAIVNDSSDQYGPDPLPCWLANEQCTTSTSTVTGTYSIAASGYGFFSSPIATITSDSVYALVSPNGILIASSTETANPVTTTLHCRARPSRHAELHRDTTRCPVFPPAGSRRRLSLICSSS